MDKELFVETINKLQELSEEQEKFNDTLRIIDPEFGGGYIHNKTIFLVEELLSKILNDKYDNISYYMWELDFGKEYEPGCITEEDGTPIPLANASDLYDLIMSSQE
jgi:hypothetical protein